MCEVKEECNEMQSAEYVGKVDELTASVDEMDGTVVTLAPGLHEEIFFVSISS